MISKIAPKVSFTKSNLSSTPISFRGVYQYVDKTPQQDVVEITRTDEKAIKDVLDKKVFSFDTNDGKKGKFIGTIREFFEHSIISKRRVSKDETMYHCTSTKENANRILENGLDWTKTSRMICGPATYFSGASMGGAEQGAGSIVIQGRYKGSMKEYPIFSPCFYKAIQYNNQIKQTIIEVSGENDVYKKLNKYCHDLILYDMGIDFLYAGSGYNVGAYAVFNDECMELSKFNW